MHGRTSPLVVALDLDDTLVGCALWNPEEKHNGQHCFAGVPEALSWLLEKGCEILIFTARAEKFRSACEEQLRCYDIPYTRLVMDKPQFDVLVDNKALKFTGWEWSLSYAQSVYEEARANRSIDVERYASLFSD
jgi:hypothetical protein